MEVSCPACHGTVQSDVLERYGEWSLYECLSCGVQHFWPARNPGADWYQSSDMYQGRDLMAVDWLAWYHQAALANLPVGSGTLIDVGCGNGTFVAAARRRGFDAVGIDFSAKAIEAGRQHFGLEQLYVTGLEGFRERFPGRTFDVVTAFEVLEHMDDARSFTAQLIALLRPGGHLIVSVPNRDRFPTLLNEGDFPPHHFTRWSVPVISRFLEDNGLRTQRVIVCPTRVTLKAFLLFHLHFGVVVRMMGRAERVESEERQAALVGRARSLMLLKDRAAGAAAAVAAPLVRPFVRGPMMVAIARRPAS